MALLRRGDSGRDVQTLQEHLKHVGFFDDVVDGVFGPETESAVEALQTGYGLAVDGTVSASTRARLDELLSEALRHAARERDSANLDIAPPEDAPLPAPAVPAHAGAADPEADTRVQNLIGAALAEWNRPVHEPPGEGWERIDSYIRGKQGLGWSWEKRYVRDRQFAWCGAFAAFCYGQVGLKAGVRRDVMPSTYRLYTWAKNTDRMLPVAEVRRGDIVLVGPAGGRVWGAHITICEEPDPAAGLVRTLEGNARGTGPDGSTYEGVIRQTRPLESGNLPKQKYRVMHVIRPLVEDYE